MYLRSAVDNKGRFAVSKILELFRKTHKSLSKTSQTNTEETFYSNECFVFKISDKLIIWKILIIFRLFVGLGKN